MTPELRIVCDETGPETFDQQRRWIAESALTGFEAKQLKRIYALGFVQVVPTTPPLRAPHHSASVAAMVGGVFGGRLVPGELSLAHGGVLILDEVEHFDPKVLEELAIALMGHCARVFKGGEWFELPATPRRVVARLGPREGWPNSRAAYAACTTLLSANFAAGAA